MFGRVLVYGLYVIDVLFVMVLFGAGVGVCFLVLMMVVMLGVKFEEVGLVFGLVNITV